MFKKLIAVLMALAVAACSAVPVYADLDQVTTGVADGRAGRHRRNRQYRGTRTSTEHE